MYEQYKISVVIPVLNEESSIGKVLKDIPSKIADEIIVVDNGSTDRTAEIATRFGAMVIHEPVKGYGMACRAGIFCAGNTDIIVFMDGDYSDFPEEMELLLAKIGEAYDMVVGSRELGIMEPGSMKLHQRLGNRFIASLINIFWGYNYTDLGPFRAIRKDALIKLGMKDINYGWTVEMQIKALLNGLKVCEVPVSYRKRIGSSKVSGTVSGSVLAGIKMIYIILKLRVYG